MKYRITFFHPFLLLFLRIYCSPCYFSFALGNKAGGCFSLENFARTINFCHCVVLQNCAKDVDIFGESQEKRIVLLHD